MQSAVPVIGRAERTHATGVGSFVSIKRSFMIARRREQAVILPINEGVQRAFRAAQKDPIDALAYE